MNTVLISQKITHFIIYYMRFLQNISGFGLESRIQEWLRKQGCVIMKKLTENKAITLVKLLEL